MTSPTPLDLNRRYTEEEYLAITEVSERKYDFVNGRMIDVRAVNELAEGPLAMAGGTEFHSLIAVNLSGEIRQALKGRPCKVYSSDLRVKTTRAKQYRYPDLSVVCGPSAFADKDKTHINLLNPTLLVEVVSPSSELEDRVEKMREYIEIESLQEYVLVSQDRPRIDIVRRQPDGTWQLSYVEGLAAVAKLPSIGVNLELNDIYAGVVFPESEEPA